MCPSPLALGQLGGKPAPVAFANDLAGSKGAVFLDFGIRFGKPGGGPKVVSSVEFDDQPLDPNTRIHTARWIGNIYTKK